MIVEVAGFSELWKTKTPPDLMLSIHDIWSKLDNLIEPKDLTKVKCVDGQFLICGGIPNRKENMVPIIKDSNLLFHYSLSQWSPLLHKSTILQKIKDQSH